MNDEKYHKTKQNQVKMNTHNFSFHLIIFIMMPIAFHAFHLKVPGDADLVHSRKARCWNAKCTCNYSIIDILIPEEFSTGKHPICENSHLNMLRIRSSFTWYARFSFYKKLVYKKPGLESPKSWETEGLHSFFLKTFPIWNPKFANFLQIWRENHWSWPKWRNW